MTNETRMPRVVTGSNRTVTGAAVVRPVMVPADVSCQAPEASWNWTFRLWAAFSADVTVTASTV
ncbi:hypothetical protein [Pseudarthrobacter humi]|uniref:hypothetical protein n=1 Tax=Pseudarthrobacter humi TaxID=2952523 RepID=UPI0020C89CB6|nr:hypothetical protein [Pseudarthrobacter humi]